MGEAKKEFKKLIDSIDDITLKVMHSDIDATKEYLREVGVDPDTELSFGMQHIKQVGFLMRAKRNQAKDFQLVEMAFDKLKGLIEENSTRVGIILKEQLHQRSASFQFRKLEEWSDDQIREVLNDLDLVTLLEKLDEE